MITKRARLIFSAYPRDDFADADMFVIQLGMVLERYPDDVILQISDPLTGIQRHVKKVPSLAQIVEACENAMDRRPRPPAPRALEPPIDPLMQERVGKLFAELAAKLKGDQQRAREEMIQHLGEASKPRREKRIRAAWKHQRQQDPPAGTLVSPELAAIVEDWKSEAAE